MTYTVPSRYNWMYQFYLRAEGIGLSWVGTGRFIFSLNYTDADVQEVLERFVSAGQRMQAHGWWREEPGLTDRAIRRSLLREMLGHLRPGV
jgi:glutamate-1-semialdehyde 2,1-aminomutase